MEQNTQDIIKARFKELPQELQKAITATDLPAKFDAISKKYALRIDQSGDLQTATILVMLGLESTEDFMKNLTGNVELSKEIAKLVSNEINTQIFNNIRSFLEKMEEEVDTTNKENTLTNTDQADLIKSIENPSANTNKSVNLLDQTPHTLTPLTPSALVDHLLSAPAMSVSETVEKVAPQPTAPATPKPPVSLPRSTDPYREPIE